MRMIYPDGKVSWTLIDSDGIDHDVFRSWLIHLEVSGRSPNTIRAYARYVARWIIYLQRNNISIDSPSISDWDRFIQWYAARDESDNQNDPKLVSLSLGTDVMLPEVHNQAHMALKSFYVYLLSGAIPHHIEPDLMREMNEKTKSRKFLEYMDSRTIRKKRDHYFKGDAGRATRNAHAKRLSPEQVFQLISACHLARDAFLIVLLYNTGVRIGEALGLRMADIDLSEGTIWITPRDDNENGARTKGGKYRAIPVNEYVVSMYEDFVSGQEYSKAFEAGTSYIFCNISVGRIGKALSFSYALKLRRMLMKRTGIHFTWHHFRHTHISEIIAQGYGLLEAADRAGHSSPLVTAEVYRHIFPSEMRKLQLNGPEKLKSLMDDFREAKAFGDKRKWIH